jgi:MFS family permease
MSILRHRKICDAPQPSVKKVAVAGLAGTTLEYYDHFIYGSAAALIFPELFFPQSDPSTGLLLSLGTYGIAFVARPMGAAIFGHFGDRIERKHILVATLLMMGIATFAIGLLPTYSTLGAFAPALLIVLRFSQGLALGGEWGGASLMVNEFDTTGSQRGMLGSLIQVASPIGLLLANGVFALVTWQIPEQALFSWGWRVPFVSSAILVIVAMHIRLKLPESPVFTELEHSHSEARAPILEVLTRHLRQLSIAIGSRVGSDICWYIFSLFLLVYVPRKLGLPLSVALVGIMTGALAQVLSVPLFGILSDRVGRRPVLLFGAISAVVWAFVYFYLLEKRVPSLIVLGAIVGTVLQAAMWAPLASFIPEMFETRVRCTGSSLAFQLAGLFGGALAPIISTSLIAGSGEGLSVALYMMAGLVLVIVATLSAKETSGIDLRGVGQDTATSAVAPKLPPTYGPS